MGIIKREQVPRPVRKQETFDVPELGGEVVLQQMTLQLYVDFAVRGMQFTEKGAAPLPTPAVRGTSPSPVLAQCVIDVDGQPVFSEEEWEAWGMQYRDVAFRLYNRIRALSGMDVEEAAKN